MMHPMPGAGDVSLPPGGVQKLLNNNVVVAIDGDGRERVLMGRGIGFQLKHDGRVDPSKVEKTFVLEQGSDTAHAQKLLTDARTRWCRRCSTPSTRPSASSDATSDAACPWP